ncbi:aromatic amino acid aminotransferase [Blastomyces dermatitidis ER-3]|uniref:Aromatic amino acid aminotransferase n=2 Tax=Ajellomyces dermatitidis TaxID=5039 RepID=F2TFZ1_AJEDA|nr:aromatic amino acid aminotransferase [Blastomyces dermatitidis ER-3]EEQ89332.1 aromatic amino acid aminotransferase [Blastomyces dermatitidis ER-3]EGE82154.1 aromatic amino acid aminotransferase [Blastomyces dermatitidis ATCC 18188]
MAANKYAIGSLIPKLSYNQHHQEQDTTTTTTTKIKYPKHKPNEAKKAKNGLLPKQPPVDLSHHFSVAAKNRMGSDVKKFYKYFAIPGIHNLAGGLPNSSYFPYDTLEATVALPTRINPPASTNPVTTQVEEDEILLLSTPPPTARLTIPKESNNSNSATRIDLATALQYGTAQGYPPLLSFIRQFVRENLHPNVPYSDGPEVILTCGATDGFSKTIEALTNVWDKDRDWARDRECILCEEFVYMNAIQTVRPRGINVVTVAMDSDGMMVDGERGLKSILENWDFSRGKRPHLMYTVTIGQNPTGAVLPVPRRRELYALCQKYDIIIIEDDPYWHLQYPSAAHELEAHFRGCGSSSNALNPHPTTPNYNAHGKPSGYHFLDSLVPSYLSIDTDGRVVRLDTFSKSIAPGCRLGWLTAQPKVVERILYITETSTQQPSGFVQAMVAGLIVGGGSAGSEEKLGEFSEEKCTGGGGRQSVSWKTDGWVRWLEGLRAGYEWRMRTMCTILEEGRSIIEHSPPTDTSARYSDNYIDEDNDDDDDDDDDWQLLHKTPLYTFQFPRGGMFVWVRMCFETHPLWSRGDISTKRLSTALWKHLMKKPFLCLVAPGGLFNPVSSGSGKDAEGGGRNDDESFRYFRLCFAPIPEGDVGASAKGFVEGCRDFWARRDLDEDEDEDEKGSGRGNR